MYDSDGNTMDKITAGNPVSILGISKKGYPEAGAGLFGLEKDEAILVKKQRMLGMIYHSREENDVLKVKPYEENTEQEVEEEMEEEEEDDGGKSVPVLRVIFCADTVGHLSALQFLCTHYFSKRNVAVCKCC